MLARLSAVVMVRSAVVCAAVAVLGTAACARPAQSAPAGPVGDVAPSALGPPYAWREVFDAAGWPDITGATRISSRSTSRDGQLLCVEGWLFRAPRGSFVLFDDLHTEWGALFWEHVPLAQRVPVDQYDEVVELSWARSARSRGGGRRSGTGGFVVRPVGSFLQQIVRPDCEQPSSGPFIASTRLVRVARARWAEMLGHPGIAAAQRERYPEAFMHDDALPDDVARILLDEARFGLTRGMPRREARTWIERARAIVRSPTQTLEIDSALASLGDDPPPWSDAPTIDALVAALADEPYFPARRWGDGHPQPSWARSGDLQIASPAWELVARGWEALPALRDAARSSQWTRSFRARLTKEGVMTLVPSTVDHVALSVAEAIAGRAFEDAGALDRWWLAVGHRGRSVALLAALAVPDERVALHAIVRGLVQERDPLVWSTVVRAMADPKHDHRSELLFAVAAGLERDDDDPPVAPRDLARARRLARPHLHDAALDVRLAAINILLQSPDARACRIAAARLAHEARARTLAHFDDQDTWGMLVLDLVKCDPAAARRVLRVAARSPLADLREAARWHLEDDEEG